MENIRKLIFFFQSIIKEKKKNLIILLLKIFFLLLIYKLLFYKYHFYLSLKRYYIPNTYRIAFVFGTRPEAIKLFPLIKELKTYKNFVCIIINTGQHKELMKEILESFHMDNSIDFNLNLMKNNQSLASLTSKIIVELEKIYNEINPNAVIVQGDTTTAFSAALSAFYQQIPIFHVEAGLRTHNIYSPFPEEFNRISIDDISTLFFAPTNWSANNLLKENKNRNNIFITGNTIVDSLYLTLNSTSPSPKIKELIKMAKALCEPEHNCKIILLTCHRRENYYKPLYNILMAVEKLLKDFNDIAIIFPFHLNPNVKSSIKKAFPKDIYNEILKGNKITNKNYLYLNRLLLISPLNYIDLIHLEHTSYFIMSDSGGIQEEAISLGKPILILRENTERPEVVYSGSGFLTGFSIEKICQYASELIFDGNLYSNITTPKNIYGKGDSSIIISKIINNYFKNNCKNSDRFCYSNYNDILFKYDNSISNNVNNRIKEFYDIVIVLTVWKRNNIEQQLIQIKNQSILKNKKTNIIIFQNSNHVDINDIVNKWKKPNIFNDRVDITFIHSSIDTGYFGRFLIPLTSSVYGETYFFICDDDVLWGNRYFENMARVVNDGYLAVRTGRIIKENFLEVNEGYTDPNLNNQVCFDEDIENDFGGQIWAGRISWLRKAWNHIPFSIKNCEDFWISAVLKSYYNIQTKVPKCPCPEENPINPDMCSASDKIAFIHENANLLNSIVSHDIRQSLIKQIIEKYNYQRLIFSKPEYVNNIKKKFRFGKKLFNLSDPLWKNVLYWT